MSASVVAVSSAIRPLTADEVDALAQQVPEFAASLRSGETEPTPSWFQDELGAARRRRRNKHT